MAVLWQNAPAIALDNGCYDGLTTVSEVKRHGNLGVGAFDQLDGEMVGVDGIFYRVTADAVAHVPEENETLPFCMVTTLGSTTEGAVPADMDRDRLVAWVDTQLEAPNLFYALRLDGSFDGITTRCLPRQQRPFPLISEVVKTQPTFSYDRVEGTMVGFRAPSYVGRISPPRYHLHFIARDRSFGGHVLGFKGCAAEIVFEQVERHELQYPTTPDFIGKSLV